MKINGVSQTVFVEQDLGKRQDTYISTTGLYDTTPNQSAEVLFVSHPTDTHDELNEAQSRAAVKKHGGDVDLKNLEDGIYVVPNGTPLHRFDVEIIPGHVYQRRCGVEVSYSVILDIRRYIGICVGYTIYSYIPHYT